MAFEEARDYVRTLGLNSDKEWWEWCKSGERPPDIPSDPYITYKTAGWLSWGDFLGYDEGHVATKRKLRNNPKRRSFTEALGYARSLGLKSLMEWREFVKSGEKPSDIPSYPDRFYKGKGWKSWGDFLGYNEGYMPGNWKDFQEAREYARTLGLKSREEWWEWNKGGERPSGIPSNPNKFYKGKGWESWPDFLGFNEGYMPDNWRDFQEAQEFARSLGLDSVKEWREFVKSGKKPSDIPSKPDQFYKNKGWKSYSDFLGFNEGHVPGDWGDFQEAREFARSLGLDSVKEWREWSYESGERPPDIPSNPDQIYKGKGWESWPDFLGY